MKFNDGNIKDRTMIKTDNTYKCRECVGNTNYIDYCTGGAYCSEECYDSAMDRMSKWARGEINSPVK